MSLVHVMAFEKLAKGLA